MENSQVRYYVKLKNGESLVIWTESTYHDSIFVQSSNGNDFMCLPRTIISKDDISYIKVNGFIE